MKMTLEEELKMVDETAAYCAAKVKEHRRLARMWADSRGRALIKGRALQRQILERNEGERELSRPAPLRGEIDA